MENKEKTWKHIYNSLLQFFTQQLQEIMAKKPISVCFLWNLGE